MQKQEYISSHGFSDALPQDPSGQILPAVAFAEAIEEFLCDHFRGSVAVKSNFTSTSLVYITPEYAALFFKMLLCYVYGRVFLSINIDDTPNGLVIEVASDSDIPLSDEEFREIIRVARNARMQIGLTRQKITLTLQHTVGKRHRVYAISDAKMRVLSKLGEIFFCGPAYNEDTDNARIAQEANAKNPLGTAAQRMKLQKAEGRMK